MDNALRGLASGVQVIAGDGQPGSGTRVRVRGIGTINNSDPLYIVDGMPISGGIDNINPADIESIEVLKDAASGAVYGARAANGCGIGDYKERQNGKSTSFLQCIIRLAVCLAQARYVECYRVCYINERGLCFLWS